MIFVHTSRPAETSSVSQYGVMLGTAALLIGCVLLRVYTPGTLHLPPCVFHELTGLYCPGCGATRALHHLLNLDFAGALRCNFLFVLALPVLIYVFALKALRTLKLWHGPELRLATTGNWLLAALVISWAIVRNLPFAWFAVPNQ
jgi:hypothetical protein